ncbi:MAG: hypothetical protein K0S46_2356 [Moraxellaceae bacterium]|jgi:alginate O-acetyltransferase complex protein AlgJ|nr:hypothetical protein [Moraxellaceae bacterium]
MNRTLLLANAALWLLAMLLGAAFAVPRVLDYELSSSLTFLDGKVAADFERFLVKGHPWRDPSVNAWAAAEFALLGEGKPGVVVGSGGWLYTRDEFVLPSQLGAVRAANLKRVADEVRALGAAGVRVYLLPVPGKVEIEPGHMPPALAAQALKSEVFTDFLRAEGLPWIDVRPALLAAHAAGTPVFFRSETHWTPEGARIVADVVALRLRADGFAGDQAFRVTSQGQATLQGDLENFVPVRPYFAALLPAPERYTRYAIAGDTVADDAAALFGDAGRPLALVGTSYSADERWNFAGWLRAALGSDLDNISEKARGPFVPMRHFRAQLASGASSARWVVWEVPVRSIVADYDAMQRKLAAAGFKEE